MFKYNLDLRQLNIIKGVLKKDAPYSDKEIDRLRDGSISLELNTIVFEIINSKEVAFNKAKIYFTNFIGNGVISKIWEDALRRYKESETSVKYVVKYKAYTREMDYLCADYRETNFNTVEYDDEHEIYSVNVQVPNTKNIAFIAAVMKAIPYIMEYLVEEDNDYNIDGLNIAVDKFIKKNFSFIGEKTT